MTVTLKEIAGIAGVSANTVSRALKDKPDIGVETKKRIKALADELGYVPNITARGLRLKKSHTIGLAVTELDNPVRTPLVEGIRAAALERGYQLLVVELDWCEESDTRLVNMFLEHNVAGMIAGTLPGSLTEHYLRKPFKTMIRRGVPIVAFGNFVSEKLDVVYEDFNGYSELLTNYLIKLGHKKITLFDIGDVSPRNTGYQTAMKKGGLKPDLFLSDNASMEGGYKTLGKYLKVNSLPDAIMARNDVQALGVLSALRDSGYSVPDDVAVTGFDNIKFAEFANPRLTTIGVDPLKLSNMLTKTLFDRIEGKLMREPIKLSIAAELHVRESCGKC